MAQATQVDIFSRAFKADPYPAYARLRSAAPVYRTTMPDGQPLWLITRYDDVEAVLKDRRFVKDWRNAKTPEQIAQMPPEPEVLRLLSRSMLNQDPPNHARLRALVSKAFTPRLIEQFRGRIQAVADSLLDAVQDKGEMDLIEAYAFPLPIAIIAEILGVPFEDREKFRRWSNAIVASNRTAESIRALVPEVTAFTEYLRTLFERRREEPEDDLVSALIQAEEAGDKLSEEELFSMVFLLLVAGHETTVNLIGNGTLALLQHPDQLEKLRKDPSLIKSAVEELLRYNGPVETSTLRFAGEDVDLGGTVIPRGEMVLVVLASADRDGEQFENPDTLEIAREDQRHLAFGHGIHYCLGAPLARLEGQIALSTLLRRMPNLRLAVAPETLTWRPGLLIRGLDRLPVAF